MNPRWPVATLGDVLRYRKQFVTIDDAKTYRRPRVRLHAEGIVLRDVVDGASIKTKSQQVCGDGDFLVAEIDAKVGGFGIVPSELAGAIVSSHYFLFETDDTKLDRRFLDWFIRTPAFREQVEAQGSTNYAAIRPADVLHYCIPVPPVAEQRRIVARIEGFAASVEEAERLRREATELSLAVVAGALRTRAATLAARYGTTQIGDLLKNADYGSSHKCTTEREQGATPVCRIPNVASEKLSFEQMKYAPLPDTERHRLLLVPGDILLVRTNGSLDLVGRSAVVDGVPEPMAFASYLIRLRFDGSRIDPRFGQQMLRLLRVDGALIAMARTTAGQYNVSLGRLRYAQIPMPPIREQAALVGGIEALELNVGTLVSAQTATGAELDALMPTILDRAFRGEL